MDAKAIEEVLRHWGIHRNFPGPRNALADKLAAGEHTFSDSVMRTLYVEAEEGQNATNPRAKVCKWLEDGSWYELYCEILESEGHIVAAVQRGATSEQRNEMRGDRHRGDVEQLAFDQYAIYCRVLDKRGAPIEPWLKMLSDEFQKPISVIIDTALSVAQKLNTLDRTREMVDQEFAETKARARARRSLKPKAEATT